MEPAIKPAAAITETGVIGVLATAGTLKADKYRDTKGRHAEDVQVVEHIAHLTIGQYVIRTTTYYRHAH